MKVYMTEECRRLMTEVLGLLPEAQITRQEWEAVYNRLDRIVSNQDLNLDEKTVQALSIVCSELEHIIANFCIQEVSNYHNNYLKEHHVSF